MDRAYPGQNNQGLDPISRMSSVRYPSRGRRQGFGVAHATFRPPQPVIRPPPLWEHSESGSLGGAIRPQTTGLQKRPPPGSVLARLEARRLDLAANKAERKRILSKKKFAGFIFGCTNNTEQECLKRQLFGLPLNNLEEVTNVMPGTPLFLFNYDQRKLIGVFSAATRGRHNIVPEAWGGSFPAQVKVLSPSSERRIVESAFKPILADNYFSGHRFLYRLEHEQVVRLCRLFNQKPPKLPPETRNSGDPYIRDTKSNLPYKKSIIMNPAVISPKDGKLFGGLRGVTITPDSVQSPDATLASHDEADKSSRSMSISMSGTSPPRSNTISFGIQDLGNNGVNQVEHNAARFPVSNTGIAASTSFQFGSTLQKTNIFDNNPFMQSYQADSAMDISPLAQRPRSFSVKPASQEQNEDVSATSSLPFKSHMQAEKHSVTDMQGRQSNLAFKFGGDEVTVNNRPKGFWSQNQNMGHLDGHATQVGNAVMGLNQDSRGYDARQKPPETLYQNSLWPDTSKSLHPSLPNREHKPRPFFGRKPLAPVGDFKITEARNGLDTNAEGGLNTMAVRGRNPQQSTRQENVTQNMGKMPMQSGKPLSLQGKLRNYAPVSVSVPGSSLRSKQGVPKVGTIKDAKRESLIPTHKASSTNLDYELETGSDLDSLLGGTEDLETAFGRSHWETSEDEFLVTALHKAYTSQKLAPQDADDHYDSDDYEHVEDMPVVSAHHIAKKGLGVHSSLWSERCPGGIVGVHGELLKRKRKLLPVEEQPPSKKSKRMQHFMKVASGFYTNASTQEQNYKNMVHNRLGFFWRSSTPKAQTAMQLMREYAVATHKQHLFDQVINESGFMSYAGPG